MGGVGGARNGFIHCAERKMEKFELGSPTTHSEPLSISPPHKCFVNVQINLKKEITLNFFKMSTGHNFLANGR